MEIEFLLAGVITGFFSGLFGIGGGTVLVPMLLMMGFIMKEAVAISIMQMVFSSIYGSIINLKNRKDLFKDGFTIGIGGSIGGFLSAYIVSYLNQDILTIAFSMIVGLSIYKVFKSSSNIDSTISSHNPFKLMIIGFIIGLIAMSVGVGGSIMLTPILITYMNYSLKNATSLGLFFVVFSSVSGFISFANHDLLLYKEGAIIGIASLVGVYIGIKTKSIMKLESYKNIILTMYITVFAFMVYQLFKLM